MPESSRRAWSPRLRAGVAVAAAVAGYTAVLLALWWRVWLGDQICGWDCMDEYWPDLVHARRAIADGEWPSWNPYVIGGYAIAADPQAGLYAPVSWLCWAAGGIGGDGPWLGQLKVILTFLAGMLGMHGWTRARTGSHVAGAVAALTLAVGTPLLTFKNSALAWPILWLPWALWAVERFAARPSPRRAAAVAVAVWLVGSAGSPPATFYAAVVLAAWTTFGIAAAPSPRRALRAQVPGLGLAAALAVALLAATYAPAMIAAEASPRAHRTLAYVLQQPLPAGQLRELFVPGVAGHWALDVYVGPLALVGGVWLIAARRGRARADAAFWVTLGVVGLLLAAGRDGVLLPWLAEHVPGFDLWRIAYRWKLVFGIAAAVLAGDAVGALRRGEGPRWALAAWGALASAWLVVGAAIDLRWPSWPLAAGALGLAAAARLAGEDGWRGRALARRLAGVLLPVIVLLDLWRAGAETLAILQRRPDPSTAAAQALAMPGTADRWRYHVGDIVPPLGGTVPYHVPALAQIRELSGYPNPLEPARRLEIEKRAGEAPALLAHFNVRYLAGHRRHVDGARRVAHRIVELPDVAPLARWYAGAEVVETRAVLDRLAAVAPSGLRAALVEPADVRGIELPAGDAPPVDGALVRYGRDELAVTIDAPAPGVLVINEAWAPGWEAEVDGRAARVFRANYHLRAVIVPAGRSTVVLRYRPAGRIALPLVFLAGMAACGALLAGRWAWLDRAQGAA